MMLIVITGGSASGKSAHAERILCAHTANKRLYLATMEPFGAEAQTRIARHLALRAGKGFDTSERYVDLLHLSLAMRYDGILLECLSNLLANELFSPHGAGKHALESILTGIDRLETLCETLVIVTNEIFSDGAPYPAETVQYITLLGQLNTALIARATAAAESVCGILVPIKGDTWL